VDEQRIKEVGPDRACAEWLLRCGAKVRWDKREEWLADYNSLPIGQYRALKIVEIDATESCVMGIGFTHFRTCVVSFITIFLHFKKLDVNCEWSYNDISLFYMMQIYRLQLAQFRNFQVKNPKKKGCGWIMKALCFVTPNVRIFVEIKRVLSLHLI